MLFEPACSLWLNITGWTGDDSEKSNGRIYIRITAITITHEPIIRPPMSKGFFMLFTKSRSGVSVYVPTFHCAHNNVHAAVVKMNADQTGAGKVTIRHGQRFVPTDTSKNQGLKRTLDLILKNKIVAAGFVLSQPAKLICCNEYVKT